MTALKKAGTYRLRFANCDNRLTLWINDELAFGDGVAYVAPDEKGPTKNDLELRERMIKLTYPFNAVGWPALALPCGAAEDGLPASVSLSARRGDDGYVLGAGIALEAALSAST